MDSLWWPSSKELLEKFLPDDLWVFREVAAVSGSQKDFNEARHLACILRDTLESRAQANDEVLIMAMALTQKPYGDSRTYAEILYNLETVVQKKEWFQRYVDPNTSCSSMECRLIARTKDILQSYSALCSLHWFSMESGWKATGRT